MDEIEDLILAGVVEVAGIDSNTGEFLYNFTDKLKEIMPALHREHMNSVNREIMFLWQKGFLDIEDLSIDNPIIRLTPKALDPQEIKTLDPDMQESMAQIVYLLSKDRDII